MSSRQKKSGMKSALTRTFGGLALIAVTASVGCGPPEEVEGAAGEGPATETVSQELTAVNCSSASAGPGEVVFFLNANFAGPCWKATIPDSNGLAEVRWVGDANVANDAITGVQVGPNVYLVEFEHADFGGGYVESDNYGNTNAKNFDVGSTCMSGVGGGCSGFNDKMSSFKMSSAPFTRPAPVKPTTGAVVGQLWNPYFGGTCGTSAFQITNSSGSQQVAPASPWVTGSVVSDGGRQKCLWQYTWFSVPVQSIRAYGLFGGRWFFNTGNVIGGSTIIVDINRHL
jgi:hypothetical protein